MLLGRSGTTSETESERTSLTFIVETVDAVYTGALVIAAQHEEVLGVFDLITQQQTYRLERLFASVDVVPEEQVVRLGREAAVLEQTQQVRVLAVDVACNTVTLQRYTL